MLNGIFIIFVLYVDDMFVASKIMDDINRLKAHMARTFDMNDIGATKQILGIEIHRDRKMVSSCFHNKSMLRKYF
jgi:hypothetical protein